MWRIRGLWDFHIQTVRAVLANQSDIKDQKTAVVADVVMPNDSNLRKKEYEKLENYQGLREELEGIWKVKVKVVVIIVAPRLW